MDENWGSIKKYVTQIEKIYLKVVRWISSRWFMVFFYFVFMDIVQWQLCYLFTLNMKVNVGQLFFCWRYF